MEVRKVFMRLGMEDQKVMTRDDVDVDAWSERMTQLLISSPTELASFITDGMMALAAQCDEKTPQEAFDWVSDLIINAARDAPNYETVFNLVRDRLNQIRTSFIEGGYDYKAGFAKLHEMSREAPWIEEGDGDRA